MSALQEAAAHKLNVNSSNVDKVYQLFVDILQFLHDVYDYLTKV